MHKYVTAAVPAALLTGLLAATSPASAAAADLQGDVASALDLPAGVTVAAAGTSNEMFGVQDRTFNDFPRGGSGSYAVMSTGRAADLFNLQLPGSQPSTSFGGGLDRAALTFAVPQGARTATGAPAGCLLVDISMGTEERVHYWTPDVPGDKAELTLNGVGMQYAKQAGPRFFAQTTAPYAPVDYTVNALQYWHGIDTEFERQPDDADAPLLPRITPFDQFTSVDTLEVPLGDNDEVAGLADDLVTLSVQDVNNNSLDTVLLVDRVRLAPHCSSDRAAETGLYAMRPFEIVGHRGVNNTLTIDLLPQTEEIERYDAADNGWFPVGGVDLRFRWYRSKAQCTTSDMKDWQEIPDADRQSFTPSIHEKGKCVLALVTGLRDGYRSETFPSPGSSQWKATLPIQDGVFTNVTAPSITNGGDPDLIRVNDLLTANPGQFTPRPDSYVYQWFADGAAISGESGQTFRVTPAQAGKRITVRVTASRLNFANLPATSAATNPVDLLVLESTPSPRIEGSGRALDELTAVPGAWLPEPVSLTYQWYVDDVSIAGASAATYRPTAAQVGKSISVHVTGRRSGYVPVTRQSPAVTITQRAFVSAPAPEIQGTGYAQENLTAKPGTWDPAVLNPGYRWFADGVEIVGATGAVYRPTDAQAGKFIHVEVTAVVAGYERTVRTSDPVVVRLREFTAKKPEILGDPYVGSSLTVDMGEWSPMPSGRKWTWLANGEPIRGASSASFMLTEAQRGKRVTVRLTASATGYRTVEVDSDPIVPRLRVFMTQAPGISGALKVGGVVRADQPQWVPGATSITYTWYAGNTFLGRGTSLVVPAAAGGQRLRLVMTGSRQYYETATATVSSAVVPAPRFTAATPSISGTARTGKTLRARPGAWRPTPTRYRYQWYVGTKAIKGATKSSYKVPKKYRNKKVRVRVTGYRTGYVTVAKYSRYKKIAKK